MTPRLSRYSDKAIGWRVRGSNPGERQLILSSPALSAAHLGSYSISTGVLAVGAEGVREGEANQEKSGE